MMAPMQRSSTAGVLAVLVLTLQVGPFLHLVTHRNDHTHGPTPARSRLLHTGASSVTSAGAAEVDHGAAGRSSADAHEAAHAEGRAHTHDPRTEDQPRADVWGSHAPYGYSTPGLLRRLLSGLAEAASGAGSRSPGPAHHPTSAPPHSHDESPAPDHGDGSAAHFGLALIETPPADPLLPSGTVAVDADVAYRATLRSRPRLRRAPRGPPSAPSTIRAC